MNLSLLTACLTSFLIEDYSEYQNWGLCPGSLNCLCRLNISTRAPFTPRCIDLPEMESHCPSKSVSINNPTNF